MVYIDQALLKIVQKLPAHGTKTALNNFILQFATPLQDVTSKKTVIALSSQTLVRCLQKMNVELTEKEMYCLLHILEREKPKMYSENSVTNIQESPSDSYS